MVKSNLAYSVSGRRVELYTATRTGQKAETEVKYRNAILALGSIEYLSLTLSQIARICGVKGEAFRNQIQRHFPYLLKNREALRRFLGMGVSKKSGVILSAEKYQDAVNYLREHPDMPFKEVALQFGLSHQALQNHVIYYHKDITESRLKVRVTALGRTTGKKDCDKKYKAAVTLYETTDLSIREIAQRTGVKHTALANYLRRHCRSTMHARQEKKQREIAERELVPKPKRMSYAQKAQLRYATVVEQLRDGKTIPKVARDLGVSVETLRQWVKKNHPDVLVEVKAGMMTTEDGVYVLRTKYEKYLPIAEYIKENPSKPTKEVAELFGVPESSLMKAISRVFPKAWKKHLEA